jgi:hypothetical protein
MPEVRLLLVRFSASQQVSYATVAHSASYYSILLYVLLFSICVC